jgi:3-oxoacyl-[acyl-carrier-protein] synthase-1
MFLALPDSSHSGSDSGTDQQDDDDRKEPWDTPERLVEKARHFSSWPSRLELARIDRTGPCGAVEMMKAAMAELDSGACQLAIVAAVDSLVDEDVLEGLQAQGRLKNPGLANGVTPGEACVLLCLRRGESLGGIAVIQAIERQDRLGDVLRSLVGRMQQSAEPMWIISDLNGESKQASEIATAILASRTQAVSPWLPAVSFGDTGVAGPFVGIAMAAAAWRRGYGAADSCVVLSSTDPSLRAGIVLGHPGGLRR